MTVDSVELLMLLLTLLTFTLQLSSTCLLFIIVLSVQNFSCKSIQKVANTVIHYTLCCRKSKPNVKICHIFYKTWPVLIKFGTRHSE